MSTQSVVRRISKELDDSINKERRSYEVDITYAEASRMIAKEIKKMRSDRR